MNNAVDGALRNQRIVKGIAGGALGRAAALAAPFIVMPVLLRHLGQTDFGIWMTVLSITSMSMFIDLGIGNGLLTKLSSAYGSANFAEMRSLISSAYAALLVIALTLLVLLGGGLMLARVGIPPWSLDRNVSDEASIVAICLVTFILGVPASVIQKVFYSCQLVWLSNVWQVLGAAVAVATCLVAVKLGWGGWQVIGAYSIPPVILMVVAATWFFRRKPEIAPSLSMVEMAKVKMLLTIGSRFLLLGVLTSVALNVDNIIIAQSLGAATVTEYAVPAKLASVLGLMVTTLFLPLWPANGEALARGDYEWVRTSTRKMSILGGIAVALVGLTLVIFSEQIMRIWMGRVFQGQTMVLLFLVLLFSVMAFTSPFNMLLNSAGRLKVQINSWVVFLVLTVLAKLIFVTDGKLWIVPMISAVGYLVIIGPSMYFGGKRVLKQGRVCPVP